MTYPLHCQFSFAIFALQACCEQIHPEDDQRKRNEQQERRHLEVNKNYSCKVKICLDVRFASAISQFEREYAIQQDQECNISKTHNLHIVSSLRMCKDIKM